MIFNENLQNNRQHYELLNVASLLIFFLSINEINNFYQIDKQ